MPSIRKFHAPIQLDTSSYDYLSLTGQKITLGQIDISDDTNLAVSSPIVLTDDTLSLDQSAVDHGSLGGLTDDDHSQYMLLAGRAGGQVLIGGTQSGDDIEFQTNSSIYKGDYIFSELTTNGFVKTTGGTGALTVATTVDISDDTNLAVTSPIVLTDDTLSWDFSTNNTWTGAQKINVNSGTALHVEQDGVNDDVLVVDTSTPKVKIKGNLELYDSGGGNAIIGDTWIGLQTDNATNFIYLSGGSTSGDTTGAVITLQGEDLGGVSAGGDVLINTADGAGTVIFQVQNIDRAEFSATGLVLEYPLYIKEQADASADTAAYGQIWVNTATPNELYFTTDAGDDREIAYAGGAFHDGFSDFVANEHIDWTNASDNLVTTGNGTFNDLIIGDARYIGSASDTDAIQIEADGDVILSQALNIVDAKKAYFGTGFDSSITYDGTDMVFNSREVGSGDFKFTGGNIQIDDDAWIGIDSPNNARLEFDSTAAPDTIDVADADFRISGNNSFYIGGADGTTEIGRLFNSAGDLTFQGVGARDIAFGSDNNTKVLFVDGNNARVGVNNITPDTSFSLDIGTKTDGYNFTEPYEVQTTDATQTTLYSLGMVDEYTYHIEARVIGVKSDGSQRASYNLVATVYRTGGGGATVQGQTTVHSAESDANWDATFTVSGNSVLVSVTGVAATTIEWGAYVQYFRMSD